MRLREHIFQGPLLETQMNSSHSPLWSLQKLTPHKSNFPKSQIPNVKVSSSVRAPTNRILSDLSLLCSTRIQDTFPSNDIRTRKPHIQFALHPMFLDDLYIVNLFVEQHMFISSQEMPNKSHLNPRPSTSPSFFWRDPAWSFEWSQDPKQCQWKTSSVGCVNPALLQYQKLMARLEKFEKVVSNSTTNGWIRNLWCWVPSLLRGTNHSAQPSGI